MSDTRAIGIFDSGVGGMTVVHEVFKKLPREDVVYFGDTARVPYGTKSPRVVQLFALQDVCFLLKQNVKVLVAACHTVSSVALEPLIQHFHLPILGVVEPGINAALKATRNNRIGVIGTRATILSETYEKKLKEKREGVTVISQPCPLFVPFAEEGWIEGEVITKVARTYLGPLQRQKIDTLILGCTHYPLLKSVIQHVVGEGVTIVDSAEEIASLLKTRLKVLGMENTEERTPHHQFFVSDIPHQFKEVGERFLGKPLTSVTRVDLESIQLENEEEMCRFSCGFR